MRYSYQQVLRVHFPFTAILRLVLAVLLPAHCVLASPIEEPPVEAAPAVQIIRVPHVYPGTNPIYDYVVHLLHRALELTDPQYGPTKLEANPSNTVQGRQLRNLEHHLLDVTWSVTSADREALFRPVFIPLAGGMFGERVMLIRENDSRFDTPMPLDQLKALRAVQGQDWPDTRILTHYGFTVVDGTYGSAFRFVTEGFVDYFPRSVLEAGFELKSFTTVPLKLERHLLVSYPSVMLFFVAKHNVALAERLETGLKELVGNGEMQALLADQAFYQEAITTLEGRTRYMLDNPFLSESARQAYEQYVPLMRAELPEPETSIEAQ